MFGLLKRRRAAANGVPGQYVAPAEADGGTWHEAVGHCRCGWRWTTASRSKASLLESCTGWDYVQIWTYKATALPTPHPRPDDSPPKGPDRLDGSRFSSANRRRLSAPGLRSFLAIADLWGLTEEQRLLILGLPSRSTYHGWVKTVREHGDITLSVDALLRISAVLGIHQALGILHQTEQEGIAWLRSPHGATVFGGRPPLDLLTCGTQDGLLTVRRFLDAARGGVYMPPNAADLDFTPYADADAVLA